MFPNMPIQRKARLLQSFPSIIDGFAEQFEFGPWRDPDPFSKFLPGAVESSAGFVVFPF